MKIFRLGIALGALIACAAIQAAAPRNGAQAVELPSSVALGEAQGQAVVGDMGVAESVDQLMKREHALLAALNGKPRPIRIMPEHESDRDWLAPNPLSPANTPVPRAARVRQRSAGPKALTLGVSFTGAVLADTGSFPPDTMGSVGPSQFFVAVNGRLRTFNKTTGVADGVINAAADTFWQPVMTPVSLVGVNFTTDPQIRYDRLTKRWILVYIDVPSTTSATLGDKPNRIMIAVSDAASNGVITGSTVFTKFFVQQNTVGGANSKEFCDYESLGVDANALYIGCNMFAASAGTFQNTGGFVVQKSSVLASGPVVVTAFRSLASGAGEGPYSPRGVDNYDPAATEGYFIGGSNSVFGELVLRRISNPGSASPSISANVLVTVPNTSTPVTVDHLGSSGTALDALDDRLFAAHIRNGRLWTAHNIGVNTVGAASTGGQTRNGSRWYELEVPAGAGTPTLVQSGTIFDSAATVAAARHFWIPSVMVSGQGHAAFGFSTAGTAFHIDAAVTDRLVTDALNTTNAVQLYTASSTAYNPSDTNPHRWGDYSYVALDPDDDMTMWALQQFCDATDSYGVRGIKLIAPPPATPASAAPASVGAGQASVNVTITGTQVAGSGFFDPGAGFARRIAASVPGLTVNSVAYNSPTSVTLNLSTVGATLGAKNVTVTNPDGQARSGSALLTITAPDTTPDAFSFPATGGQQSHTFVNSSYVFISGINAAAPVHVGGDSSAMYSVRGEPFTKVDGTVANGERIRLRLVSARPVNGTATATLNVGGVNANWTVTTTTDKTPAPFSFPDVIDVPARQFVYSDYIVVEDTNAPAAISVAGNATMYSINGAAFTPLAGNAPAGARVRLRTIASGTAGATVQATLTIGGVAATWKVTRAP
jgi:hypothetical protein